MFYSLTKYTNTQNWLITGWSDYTALRGPRNTNTRRYMYAMYSGFVPVGVNLKLIEIYWNYLASISIHIIFYCVHVFSHFLQHYTHAVWCVGPMQSPIELSVLPIQRIWRLDLYLSIDNLQNKKNKELVFYLLISDKTSNSSQYQDILRLFLSFSL